MFLISDKSQVPRPRYLFTLTDKQQSPDTEKQFAQNLTTRYL